MNNPDAIQLSADYYSQLCDAQTKIEQLEKRIVLLETAGWEIANEDVRFRDWDKFREILSQK